MNASLPDSQVTALVVDDEQLARNELCYQLERAGSVEVLGQADNGIEAIRLVDALEPDVVFLDVQMPGLTGFEVARQLAGRASSPHVVFVTAYDQHAIEAFEVNAVDYLLKPVDASRLEQAIARVRRRGTAVTASGPTAPPDQHLERIVQLVADRQQRRERLALRVGERFHLVPADDVVFASVADDVITVVAGGVIGTSSFRTLDELHAHLDPTKFWRVHRSHLVNINKVKEIVPWFSRNYLLRMADPKGSEIPVSRSQTKRLREYLGL